MAHILKNKENNLQSGSREAHDLVQKDKLALFDSNYIDKIMQKYDSSWFY